MDRTTFDEFNRWLLTEGLKGSAENVLIADFCQRVRSIGLNLEQCAVFMDTLHPVLESIGYVWTASQEHQIERRQFLRPDADGNAHDWKNSPFNYVLQLGLDELYVQLPTELADRFPLIEELQQDGHTGYFVLIHPLAEPGSMGEMDSLYSRWSTKQPGGFTEFELEFLRQSVRMLALCVKAAALRKVTGSLVELYLGRDAGKRVLEGRIERGKVESIDTVLWFSDMRNFTALSEQIHSNDLIALLDDYAEAVISSVHSFGGEVLKLIGDGVLAIFNHPDPRQAAASSIQAWHILQERLRVLNATREAAGLSTTSIYAGLHAGEVFYGNFGSDERLDFTVIGPAVNIASRVAASCRVAGRALLASDEFFRLLNQDDAALFDDLGGFQLRGVALEKRLHGLVDTN